MCPNSLGEATVPEMSLESNTLLTSNLFLDKGFMRMKMIARFTRVRSLKNSMSAAGVPKAPAGKAFPAEICREIYCGFESCFHNPKVMVLNPVDLGCERGRRNAYPQCLNPSRGAAGARDFSGQ